MRVNVELDASDPGSPSPVPPPSRRALIDSSPLSRFIGAVTFVSVASNWSAAPLAADPDLGPDSYGSGVKDKG